MIVSRWCELRCYVCCATLRYVTSWFIRCSVCVGVVVFVMWCSALCCCVVLDCAWLSLRGVLLLCMFI